MEPSSVRHRLPRIKGSTSSKGGKSSSKDSRTSSSSRDSTTTRSSSSSSRRRRRRGTSSKQTQSMDWSRPRAGRSTDMIAPQVVAREQVAPLSSPPQAPQVVVRWERPELLSTLVRVLPNETAYPNRRHRLVFTLLVRFD